jgi:hypothetical protein
MLMILENMVAYFYLQVRDMITLNLKKIREHDILCICITMMCFFFPWAYYTVFSGAGVVSGTLHPAVWDTHIIFFFVWSALSIRSVCIMYEFLRVDAQNL